MTPAEPDPGSDPGARRRIALERLLGQVAREAALDTIEDRVADSGHLEDEDYERVRTGAGAGIANLRRHVLFCAVCGAELLRRAAPDAEPETGPGSGPEAAPSIRRARRQVWVRALALVLVALLAHAAVKWILRHTGDEVTTDGRSPDAGVAPAVAARAGTGRLLGRSDAADRLFVRRAGAPAGRPAHVYAFLLAGDRVVPLHPGDRPDQGNPLAGDLLPGKGWEDPGGARPRHLLLILADDPLPSLATAGDRSSAADSIERRLAGGIGLGAVVPTLDALRGTVQGLSLVLPVEE